jgi:hypothetical protein
VGEGGPLGAADDVLGVFAFALEEHVGFADGVGLGVDLLAVEAGLDGFAAGGGELAKGLLGDGEHAAGAARAVIEEVGARFDFLCNRQEDQIRHELHGVTGSPVLARFLVVLLVKPADELLEERPHGVVVEAGRADVDLRREELLDERAECVGFGELGDLVAKLEVLQDVLDVRGESVEIGLEVGLELLLARAGLEVTEGELRCVVEGLARGLAKGSVLVRDLGLIERGLHLEHGLLRRLEHRVQSPQDHHGQDHVPVFPANVEIPEDVVRDTPDEVGDPREL